MLFAQPGAAPYQLLIGREGLPVDLFWYARLSGAISALWVLHPSGALA